MHFGKDKEAKNEVQDFSIYFSSLAEDLVKKLSNTSNKYAVLSVAQYYSHLGLPKNFGLLPTEKNYILKILRDIATTKAASIDRLPGKLLKDDADVS